MSYRHYGTTEQYDREFVDSPNPRDRKIAADMGYGLDKLIENETDIDVLKSIATHCNNDPDIINKLVDNDASEVRVALVKYNKLSFEKLDMLANDDNADVRLAVAEKGVCLDRFINDEDVQVRKTVAEWRYGLDKLVSDPDWEVRVSVLEAGYGYKELINDPEPVVSSLAKDVSQKMQEGTFFEYVLKNGDIEYGLTSQQCKAIEGAMFITHCVKWDTIDVVRTKHQLDEIKEKYGGRELSDYSMNDAQRVFELQKKLDHFNYCVNENEKSLLSAMDKMEANKIPNWIGNAAMQWAKEYDLKNHYMSDFFTKSRFAAKSIGETEQVKKPHKDDMSR